MNADALLLGLLLCLDALVLFKSGDSLIMGDCVTLSAFLFLLTAQLGFARVVDCNNAVPCVNGKSWRFLSNCMKKEKP